MTYQSPCNQLQSLIHHHTITTITHQSPYNPLQSLINHHTIINYNHSPINYNHQRLHNLGVRGSALTWFRSYLSERTQAVLVKGVRSDKRKLNYGVPQGSVLGPILFTVYTIPLGAIARKYNLRYHLYADDKQLYISFKPADSRSVLISVEKIQQCYMEIKSWMTINLLKLNDDKTELLLIIKNKLKNVSPACRIELNSVPIFPSTTIRNLGVYFDQYMNMESFVPLQWMPARP